MNIATALNKKFLPYTLVMLTSLCINHPEEPICAFLLHEELTNDDFRILVDALKNFNIKIVSLHIKSERLSNALPITAAQWPVEIYFRLFLTDFLEADVDRLLYLDGDIIVNKNILAFYSKNFYGNDLIVCENSGGYIDPQKYFNQKQNEMFARHLSEGLRFFNSGVLLMNIAAMRGRIHFQTYLDAMKEWNYELSYPDQELLNYVHWPDILYADADKYNCFARIAHERGITYEEGKKSCYILHYTDKKPWETGNYHFPLEKLWWDYAKKTPLYDDLLESFLNKTLSDPGMEQWMRTLIQEQQALQDKLASFTKLSQPLLAKTGEEGDI